MILKILDNFNPFNFLSYLIPACSLLISQRQRQKRLYDGLIRKHQNMIYAFELNQRISAAEIEALHKRCEENIKKAEEIEEAIEEKRKLPHIDMDELRKEQEKANHLKAEAGKIERSKDDYNKDGSIKFNTIPELIRGQETVIQNNLNEIQKNQMTIGFIKKERTKL